MSVSPDMFTALGLDTTTAAELARQHETMSSSPQLRAELVEQLSQPAAEIAPSDRAAYFLSLGVSSVDARRLAAEEAGMSRQYLSPEQRVADSWQQSKDFGARLVDETATLTEHRFKELYEEVMTPAKNAHDYQIPRETFRDMTPDEQAIDTAIREAMIGGNIPVFAGNAIADEVNRVALHTARMSPDTINQHLQTVAAQLRGMWGNDYQANVARVSNYVDGLADKHPIVGAILDSAPHLIGGSALVMDQLLQIAKHQRAQA